MTQAASGSYTANATSIPLPYDFKDVYDLRITTGGYDRTLVGIPRRLYDRVIQQQGTSGYTIGYDLFQQGSNNVLSLEPAPNSAGTYDLKYYRRMWVPCTIAAVAGRLGTDGGSYLSSPVIAYTSSAFSATLGSMLYATAGAGVTTRFLQAVRIIDIQEAIDPITEFGPYIVSSCGINVPYLKITLDPDVLLRDTGAGGIGDGAFTSATIGGDSYTLDIPEDYENGIIAWAVHHFLSALGAPESRLAYFIKLANDELAEALKANELYEDQDTGFELGDLGAGSYHPNQAVHE